MQEPEQGQGPVTVALSGFPEGAEAEDVECFLEDRPCPVTGIRCANHVWYAEFPSCVGAEWAKILRSASFHSAVVPNSFESC